MSRAAGAVAERQAAEFLRGLGYLIIESNFTVKGGEIDLICDDAGTLVFVEVRSRKNSRYGTPQETISATKRRRIVLAARHYLVMRKIEDRACRFDVVAIEGEAVTHLSDAFSA